MINCFLLAIVLLILLIINYYVTNKNIMEPSFIFNASFFVSSFFLIFASIKWKVDISLFTVIVIIFSVFLFTITCYLIRSIFKNVTKKDKSSSDISKTIVIKKWILISYMIFSIIVIILNIYFTVKAVDGDFNHIGTALYKYRNYTLRYKYDLPFPRIVDILGGIVHASSYYFIFIFINNLIVNKKFDVLLAIISIITTVSTVLDGTRGAIINIFLSTIPMFLILYQTHNKKNFKFNRKIIIFATIVFIVFLTQFQRTAVILGRDDAKAFSSTEYLNIYLAAPIYNFDTFLNQNIVAEKYIGIHTFSTVYDIFGNFTPENKQVFRILNGNNIGNVYTILFDFICDGKIIGLILGVILMSTISQLLYEKIRINMLKVKNVYKPDILIIIYSYIFGGLVFSFFGNKFFNQIFNTGFVKYIILWFGLNLILFRKKECLK